MTEGARPGRITLRELAAGVRDDLLQWDRGIVGAFVGLIWNPAAVIRGFIEDRNDRFAKPWRYLLFTVVAYVATTWFVLDNLGFRTELGLEQHQDQVAFLLDNAAILTLLVLPFAALVMRVCFIGLNVRYIDALIALFYTQGQTNLYGVMSLVILALSHSQAANLPISAAIVAYLFWAWAAFARGPWWRRLLASLLTLVGAQVISALIVSAILHFLA
ncbi:MAG: DUF3667 domain-containing protein [Hyphomonadaceae bacterium]|nr:DUF3667 domain-containing protein [Hyphomonadaceae bacterium]MCA8885519.1 DUF3667 domain-containing protein [Hyphomonadaceae bacterium]